MAEKLFKRVAGGMAAIILAEALSGCASPRNPNTATPVPVTANFYPTEVPPTPTETPPTATPKPTERPTAVATAVPAATVTPELSGTGGQMTPEQQKTYDDLMAKFKGYEQALIARGIINAESQNKLKGGWYFDASFDPMDPSKAVVFLRTNDADGNYRSGWLAVAKPASNDNPYSYEPFDYVAGAVPFEVQGAEVQWAPTKDGKGRQANIVRVEAKTKAKAKVNIQTMRPDDPATATAEAMVTQIRPSPSATSTPVETLPPTATPEIRYKVAEYALNAPAKALNVSVEGLRASFAFTGTNDKASGFKIRFDNGQYFNLFDFLKPGIVAQLTDQNGKPSSSADAQKIVEGVMEGTIEFSSGGLAVKSKDGKTVAMFETASAVGRVVSIDSLNPSSVTGSMTFDSGKKPVEAPPAPPAATQAPRATEAVINNNSWLAICGTGARPTNEQVANMSKTRISQTDSFRYNSTSRAMERIGSSRAVDDVFVFGHVVVNGITYTVAAAYNGVLNPIGMYQCFIGNF